MAVVILRSAHLGKAGVAGCFWVKRWKCLSAVLPKHLHLHLYSILCSVISIGQGSLLSLWLAKQNSFWASWRHLNVFAVTGSVALWWDAEFGVALDWLLLIENEISGIWVQANQQQRRTSVILQALVLTMSFIWKKYTWTNRCWGWNVWKRKN